MAELAIIGASFAAMEASSYRVKLRRREFLVLVDNSNPKRIYKRGRNQFFAFDGFLMYIQECMNRNFSIPVIETIELSNSQ